MFIGDIAEREAARTPDKVAIIDAGTGREVTFGQLSRRVNALAAALGHLPGLVKGDRVAMLCLNRIEGVELYLGAARAGMVATSLNWRLAVQELEQIVKDCTARVLVYEPQFAAVAKELARRCDLAAVLAFGDGSDGSYEEFLEAGVNRPIEVLHSYNDPAMILYTGGTTGKSKGVVHTLGSLIGAMVNNTIAERIVADDRYILLGPMFHSASILALNYLMNGATLILLPKFEPAAAMEAIEALRATKTLAFPAMLNYLIAEAGERHFDLKSLRNVQYGGGPISERFIRQMAETLQCGLLQCYGTTEQVGVSFLSPEDHREAMAGRNAHRLLSAGRAGQLSLIRLFDAHGRLVPQDGKTQGEIFVQSAGNMLGYWNRPDLTDALRGPNGSMGTGDLAVWDKDGYIYVVDRAKEMIISGGENIYPAQVEKAIAEHSGILEVAVVGVPDELWGETVVAFVVPHKGIMVTSDEVRSAVTDRLGSYQKPRMVHFVDELPKSAGNKIAKGELRKLALAVADAEQISSDIKKEK